MSGTHKILTTHAGSLPRPAELVDLFTRRSAGETIDPALLKAQIELATQAIVPRQIRAGIDIPNNGEQGREAFFLYLRHRLSGFAPGGTRRPLGDIVRYPLYQQQRQRMLEAQQSVSNFSVPKVVEAIRYLDVSTIEDECAEFRRVLDSEAPGVSKAFMTAPSPGIIAAAIPNEHYESFEAYLNALSDALKVEYEAIVAHGFLLQLDCPDLALERHVTYDGRPLSEFLAFDEMVVAAINRALVNIPRESVRMHACWGNYEGPHDLDVPLADILPILMQARVGAIVLPFANPRHAHEIKELANTPLAPDQTIVCGVIDTTTNYVEHPEVVAGRIEQVARAMGGPERVIAGTDCGFDTSAGMGKVAEDVVWAKLRALAEGAALASQRLY